MPLRVEGTDGAGDLPDTDLEDEGVPEELTELYDQAVAAVIAEERPSVNFYKSNWALPREGQNTARFHADEWRGDRA